MVAFLLGTSSIVVAQKAMSVGQVVSETFTIEAIDYSTRVVTLKDKEGAFTDVWCGPEVQRFEALRVGDKMTFRYHESLVTAIQLPGAVGTSGSPESVGLTGAPGGRPGGTLARQVTAAVTIESINPKTPAMAVVTDEGRRMSLEVEHAKDLKGYKPGDKVIITYTEALAISVTPAKKK